MRMRMCKKHMVSRNRSSKMSDIEEDKKQVDPEEDEEEDEEEEEEEGSEEEEGDSDSEFDDPPGYVDDITDEGGKLTLL